MPLHVLFTPEGDPSWFGTDPRPGTEAVAAATIVDGAEVEIDAEFLATHRRLKTGDWVKYRDLAPLHATFNSDGLPAWIGPDPREDSEELPLFALRDGEFILMDIMFLAGHMRLPDGRWMPRPTPAPPTEAELAARAAAELENSRRSAAQVIDDLVTAARLRFVTQLPGQEAIYLAKEAEARVYVATMPEPDSLEDFPYLAAEVGITAPTARELAEVWLQRGSLFRGLGAYTENRRMAARRAVAEAESPDVVTQILNELSANLDALG